MNPMEIREKVAEIIDKNLNEANGETVQVSRKYLMVDQILALLRPMPVLYPVNYLIL